MKKIIFIILFLISFVNFSQEGNSINTSNIPTKEVSKPLQEKKNEFKNAYSLRDTIALHIKNQKYEKVPELLKKLKKAHQLKLDTVSAMVNEVHAKYYYYTGEYENSANYLIETAKIYLKMGDSLGVSMMYSNIAEMLEATKTKPKESLNYKFEALKLCPESLDAKWHTALLHNISETYFKRSLKDSSKHYLKMAFDKSKAIDYKMITGLSYIAYAKHSINEKKYNEAIAYIDSFERNYKEDVRIETFQDAILLKAEGNFKLRKIDEAERNLKQIENDVLAANLEPINHLLSKIYEKQGRFKDAYFAIKNTQKFKDSIFNLEKQVKVLELQEQYENEKKEKENLLLKQEATQKDLTLTNKNNLLLLIVALSMTLIALLTYFWNHRVIREKEKRNRIEQQLRRAQINPHFFFNVLNTIQHKILSATEKKDSIRYISKFSKLMRQTLETSFNDFIDIDEEVAMLENYIQLQKIRYKSKFDYTIENNCDEIVNIPTQIVQPFIENAIEHGFKKIKHAGNLKVIFSLLDDEVLKAEVIDNGVGFKAEKNESKHQSRALEIIKERLSLFGKKHKFYHTFSSGSKGTHITIYCPYQ